MSLVNYIRDDMMSDGHPLSDIDIRNPYFCVVGIQVRLDDGLRELLVEEIHGNALALDSSRILRSNCQQNRFRAIVTCLRES